MRIYVFVLLALLSSSVVSAIGVSPPRIILEDVPKGFEASQSVTLSGVPAQSKITITFSGQGASWVTSQLGQEFTFGQESSKEIPFKLSIPESAPNGNYEVLAQIVASEDQKSSNPNSATVSSGVMVNILFTITGKQVKEYRITNVQIPSFESGSDFLVVMNVINDGNVLAKPNKVRATIKDMTKEIVTSKETTDITEVQAYAAAESIASFDLKLEPSFYFADIVIHMDDKVEEIKDIPFDVLEKGTSESDGQLTKLQIQDNVGEIAKIEAHFSNTGQVDLLSTLKGEIYFEGELVTVFESDEEYVGKGEQKIFTEYYNVPKKGTYTVKAHIEYLGKKTQSQEMTFFSSALAENQKGSSTTSPINTTNILIIAAIIILILCTIIIVMKVKKK